MAKEFRLRRLADLIKTNLAVDLLHNQDSWCRQVTINRVLVSKDLSLAKCYISCLGSDDPKLIVANLNGLAKNLRYQLAQNCNLRVTPQLKFYFDDTHMQKQKIIALLQQI